MAWGSRKLRELLPGTPRDRVHKRRHLCAASALFAAAVSPRGFTIHNWHLGKAASGRFVLLAQACFALPSHVIGQ
jgi:hypothetical protein